MKQPALMISNFLFWKESWPQTHLKWPQEGAGIRVTWTQSLHGISNRCSWLVLSVSFWFLLGSCSCWWGVLLSTPWRVSPVENICDGGLWNLHPENCWFYYCCSFFSHVAEYLERSKVSIFLQSKANPSPILDIDKGPMVLAVTTGTGKICSQPREIINGIEDTKEYLYPSFLSDLWFDQRWSCLLET